MVHTCNLNIFEVEAEGSRVQGQGAGLLLSSKRKDLSADPQDTRVWSQALVTQERQIQADAWGSLVSQSSQMLVLGSLRGTQVESRGNQTLADTHKDLGTQKEFKDSLGCYTVLVANLHYLKLSFRFALSKT